MPAGRPPKYQTVEELSVLIDSYFKACDDSQEPYTVSGLAYALDMHTDSLRRYEQKDEFYATIKRAKQKVEQCLEKRLYDSSPVGAIFNLKNNFGWKDKTEQEHSGNVTYTKVERVICDPENTNR